MEKKKDKKSESGKNKSKNKNLIAAVYVFLVILVVVLLIFFWRDIFPKKESLDRIYNGYIFEQAPPLGLWNVTVKTSRGDAALEFYYHPQQLEALPYDENFTEAFKRIKIRNGKFFVGYDVNFSYDGMAAVAGAEVAKITGPVLRVETKAGLLDEYVGNDKLLVVNCSNADSLNMVIELRLGNETSFFYDDYCAVIYASSPEEMVKMTDMVAYHLLNVMPNRMN